MAAVVVEIAAPLLVGLAVLLLLAAVVQAVVQVRPQAQTELLAQQILAVAVVALDTLLRHLLVAQAALAAPAS